MGKWTIWMPKLCTLTICKLLTQTAVKYRVHPIRCPKNNYQLPHHPSSEPHLEVTTAIAVDPARAPEKAGESRIGA